LLDLGTEVLRGPLSLFGLAAEGDSETASEACKPGAGETEILIIKPPRAFILGDTAGIKLAVNSLRMLQNQSPEIICPLARAAINFS
jgi:hypothetical protein